MSKIKTIGVVSPSFFIEKENEYLRGINYFKEKSINIRCGNCVGKRFFNTTGTAKKRAEEINQMFADPEIDLIIASDGGCRAIEVLEYLDYETIKNNPKPLCGFSDITHILLAVYTKTHNAAIHGMDILNGFGQKESKIKESNLGMFWKTLKNGSFEMSFQNAVVLKTGRGEGKVIGGWLNAIQHLAGTEYFPREDKIILFWEAIEEEPNKINMMLHSLRLVGLFDRLEGMVVGKLCNCKEKEYYDCIPKIESIILDVCEGYEFPVIINAPFGHEAEKTVFQYGTVIKINTEEM